MQGFDIVVRDFGMLQQGSYVLFTENSLIRISLHQRVPSDGVVIGGNRDGLDQPGSFAFQSCPEVMELLNVGNFR